MPSQKGQGLAQQDKRPWKRPVLNPRRHASFRKNPIELNRYIRPEKGDARSRKHTIKKRCTIHHANRKMGGGWHRCLYKTHFVFLKPDLRKIGDDCSIKIGRQPAPASKTKYFVLQAPSIRISNNIRFRQRRLGGVASKKFETPWQATQPLIALRQAAATQISMANRIKRRCSSALFRTSRPISLISPSRQAMPRKLHAPKRRSRRAGRDFRPAPPRAPPLWRRRNRQCPSIRTHCARTPPPRPHLRRS